MDEKNKNMNPGGAGPNQGNEKNEGQEEIKIWRKPETGRKKIYVYEVKTEESEEEPAAEKREEESKNADGHGSGEYQSGEYQSGEYQSGGYQRGEYQSGESGTTSYSSAYETIKDPSSGNQPKRGYSKENHSKGSKEKKAAKKRLFRKKSAEDKPEKRRRKKEAFQGDELNDNILEKDNVSKSARQEFWRKQMVEGTPNQKGVFRQAAEAFGRHYKRILSIALIVAVVFGGSYYYNRVRKYHSYEVEWQISAADDGYSNYLSFQDVILHYSQDGVSCINQNGEVMWNQAFNMDVPGIAVREDYAVIYDIKGTSLYICNADGCTGSAETSKKILKADISASGVVAVVLDDKTSNYINYFKKDGSQLGVEIKTLISGDGYPLDIAISPDGTQLMCSYMYANSGSMMNQVVFRNFEVGKNEVDRVVGGFREYKETLVPEVIYFDNQSSAAITENSIDFYSTKNALEPKLLKTQKLESRIKTVFYNQGYVGVVLDGSSEQSKDSSAEESKTVESAADEGTVEADVKKTVETAYAMMVFDQLGNRVFEQEIDFEYDYADFSDDGIVVYNGEELAVYNMNGVCKYHQRLDVNIEGVMRFSEKSLVIHGNGALQKITLK